MTGNNSELTAVTNINKKRARELEANAGIRTLEELTSEMVGVVADASDWDLQEAWAAIREAGFHLDAGRESEAMYRAEVVR